MWNLAVHKASGQFCFFALFFTISISSGTRAAVSSLSEAAAPVDDGARGVVRVDESSDGVLYVDLSNGISARVFSSSYLEMRTVYNESGGEIDLGDGRYLKVITDINDQLIHNKGDGEFHPFAESQVVEALGDISYPGLAIELSIYILPYPRVNILLSSTSGSEIFLSPHVLEITEECGSYIITHEAGHTFQNKFLPRSATSKWKEYRQIRGIENDLIFSDFASHPYRPAEIFAEDFRVLYGGEAARFEGRIENPELPSPLSVAGLKDFYISLAGNRPSPAAIISLSNYPNPFNPQTEIHIVLSENFLASRDKLFVSVYDVTGALIRELHAETPLERNVRVTWDGRNSLGMEVASSTYFCMVRAGQSRKSRKMLMIK